MQTQVPEANWNIAPSDLYWNIAIQDRPVIVSQPPNFSFGSKIKSARVIVFFFPNRPAEIDCQRRDGHVFLWVPVQNPTCAAFAQSRFTKGNHGRLFVLSVQHGDETKTQRG